VKRLAIHTSRRAVTLIEAVIVVVVLALAVPPMLSVTADAVDARTESVRLAQATTLAQGVAEHILADVHASGGAFGIGALTDTASYLEHPTRGLRARLSWLTESYEPHGISWNLEVGEPVDARGIPSGDASSDRYRHVRVVVSFSGSRGRMSVPVTLVVGGEA